MKIPSYDDLERGIVDVHPRDTFDFAARVVQHTEEPVVRTIVAAGEALPRELFACVRTRGAERPGALLGLARDFSPRLERHGDDTIVLDASGLGRLLGDAPGIAVELARTAADRGLKVQIALAPTQTAARLLAAAANAGDAPVVVTADVASALAPLPLAHLGSLDEAAAGARPVQGGSPALVTFFDVLRRWGLRTIGELAGLPADEIAARFGGPGVAMHRRARGLDPRPLVPDPGVPRFVESMELEWPIEELEPLSFVLARLLDPLTLALERADKGAAAIRLDLRLVTRVVHTRMLQLPAAMRDARVLRTLLLLDLESHPPSAGIDVATIEVDPAPGRIVQFSLLERPTPSPETIATLTARLAALVGEDRCGSPVLLDSHRPDALEMQRFGDRLRQGSGGSAAALRVTAETLRTHGPTDPRTHGPSDPRTHGPADPRTHGPADPRTHGPRDPRTHGPTDPGTHGPRDPRTHGPSFRRFRPPIAIRVVMDRGRPVHIPIDRKGMPGGRVQQSAGPWRSSGAWWDHGQAWDRDEWDVELADGCVCRVFQVRDTGVWFMEGVLD